MNQNMGINNAGSTPEGEEEESVNEDKAPISPVSGINKKRMINTQET
jgi:hypothetical protein